MPSLVATDVAKVDMQYICDQQTVQNSFYVKNGAGWNEASLGDLTSFFANWFTATVQALLSSAISLFAITATDLTSLDSARVVDNITPPEAGTVTGDFLPLNATLAVQGSIGHRGRGVNARVYWPILAESQVTGNQVNADTASSIQDALDVLQTTIGTSIPGAQLGVIHRQVNGVKVSPAPFDAITGWGVTDRTIDSQRDRLPRHRKASKKKTA